MRLIPARSLDDYQRDDDLDLSGWRERETRKDRRRRRRQTRRERRHPDQPRDVPPSSFRRAAPLRPDPDEDPTWRDAEDDDADDTVDLLEAALDQIQGTRRRRRPRSDGAWSQAVRMSRNLRIQAARGYRAAVMELRPGLYLVAEMPEDAARAQFGFVPFLAPLMIRSARRAMERHDEPPARPMLPGPVAPTQVIDVGWAEPDDVVGCSKCSRRCA